MTASIYAADGVTQILAGAGISITPDVGMGTVTISNLYAEGAGVTAFNSRTGLVTLTSADIVSALGYTPANSTDFTGYATIASPNFTGNPTAPTPTVSDNTTKLATTAFVKAVAQSGLTTGSALLAGDGNGGIGNVTIGSGLSYSAGTLSASGGSGSVTSVGLSLPGDFTVSNSPVTGTGTLTAVWASTPTGTGAVVKATSPTITTPVINGFTGDTSAINIGSGQIYKDTSGNLTIGGSVTLSGATAFPVTGIFNRAADTRLHLVGGAAGISFDAASGASTVALIDANTGLLFYAPTGIGYGTGSGGTATQPTNQGQTVVLNKPSGVITMASGVGTNVWNYFRVDNSKVSRNDTVTLTPLVTNTNLMLMIPFHIWDGYFFVAYYSFSGTSTDTPKFQFNLHKGATA